MLPQDNRDMVIIKYSYDKNCICLKYFYPKFPKRPKREEKSAIDL